MAVACKYSIGELEENGKGKGEVIKTCNIIFPEYKMDFIFKREESLAEAGKEAGMEAGALAAGA